MSFAVSADEGVAELVIAGSGMAVAEAGQDAHVRFEWDASAPADAEVLWVARPVESAVSGRVIGPLGYGLWRHAPWPAADALFDLGPPDDGGALVIGGERATDAAARLDALGVTVTTADRLTRRELEETAVVVLVGDPGDVLPGEVPAILASGRVLVTTPRATTFGFRAGIDHCRGEIPSVLAELTSSVLRHWDAFAPMRTHGRIAASRHRASGVLRDLMTDLELGF